MSRIPQGEKFQVVFLIDENSTGISDGVPADEASNTLSLSILRVLSFFNEHRIRNSSSLVWGFKFYSSSSLTHRYERHNFKDFCVTEFEKFEKNLDSRFKESSKYFQQQQQQHETNSQLPGSSKIVPAKCLTCALTDLIHDFQWETNDINSPLRTTRRSNLSRSCKRNIVFLVTSCPKSYQSLEEFIGKSVQNAEEFQSTIMSQALFREFVEIYGINLFWIDTNYNNPKDYGAILMINRFLQILQGTIIPIQALVHMNEFLDTCGTALSCEPNVPVMSILNHYINCTKNVESYANEPSLKSVSLQKTNDIKMASSKWIGLLCSPGVQPRVHCTLKLHPMFSIASSESTSNEPLANSSIKLISTNSTHKCDDIHKSLSHDPTLSNSKIDTNNQPNLFWIKGVLQRNKVCPTWLHMNYVYSCVAMVTEQEQRNKESALSGWFQRLMLCLSKKNLLLIIEMKEPSCCTPVTSVLQPLTSICGVISVVNTDRLVLIEKLLLWNQGQNLGESFQSKEEQVIEIKDLKMAVTDEEGSRVPTQLEIHSSLPVVQSSDKIDLLDEPPKSFSMQDLNTWSLGLACLQEGPHIMKQTSVDEREESINSESSLIIKLKELYSKKKTKPSHTRLKTPQKSKSGLKASSKKKKKRKPEKQIESISKKDISMDINSNSTGAEKDEKNNENKIQEMLDNLDLNDESDLVSFLKDVYCQAVSKMDGQIAFIDKLAAVIEWYNKKEKQQASKVSLEPLLTDHLILDNLAIRDKHEENLNSKENKLTEYQIQVLLRLELALSKSDQQQSCSTTLVDEVVVMLRSISFVKDPGFLRDFLREVILPRYVNRIPNFLIEIYEGLMQDLPPELLSPSKQNEEESPLKRSHIASVVRPESDQPSSDLSSRPLTRHRSIAAIGGKRREIVIPGKAKTKTKKKTSQKSEISSLQQKSNQHKPKAPKTPVKKVRRNLFTEGSESKEGEGEEGQKKVKLKVNSVFAKEKHAHNAKQSKRRHSVAASKVVLETPGRRQLHNALWHRQERARKRASTVTEELEVVKESPLKDIVEGNLPRRSPRRHPGSVFQRSKSFYGENPQSCPLVRTRSFSTTIQPESPLPKLNLQNQDETSGAQSEDVNVSTLASDISAKNDNMKESPIRFTPRKRNRFTLHTLLTTTEASNTRSKKSKVVTPKKDVPPVRSSPRLLKKRSFSCIEFSNSSQLDHIKQEKSSYSKAVNLKKSLSLTPTRSSPRLKKIDVLQTVSNSSTQMEPRLSKNLMASSTKSPARSTVTQRESSQISHSSGFHPSPKTPKMKPQKSTKSGSELCNSSEMLSSPSEAITSPRKKLLQTPTRSSPRVMKTETAILESTSTRMLPTPKKLSSAESTRTSPRLRNIRSCSSRSPSHEYSSPTFKKQIVKSPTFDISFGKEEAKEFNHYDEVQNIIEGLSNLKGGSGCLKGNVSHNKSQELINIENEVIFNKVQLYKEDDLSKSPARERHAKGRQNRLQLSRSKSKQRSRSVKNNYEMTDDIHASHLDCNKEEKVSHDLEEDHYKEGSVSHKVKRSSQKKTISRSLDSILNEKSHGLSFSKSRSKKASFSNSDFSEGEEPYSSSRKRLSFSPLRLTARKRIPRRTRSEEKTNCIDAKKQASKHANGNYGQEERQEPHLEAASSLESNPSELENERSNHELSNDSHPRTLRLSTRQNNSHLAGSQRLLTSKQSVCTPPRKRKRARTQTPNEKKRSSPLNQILKQRKRNRPEALKSPRTKRVKVENDSIASRTEHKDSKVLPFGIHEPAVLDIDDCSRSSEDMCLNWFKNISVKQSLDSNLPDNTVLEDTRQKGFDGSDEDDVFQDLSFSLRSKLGPLKPTTPLSAKSIQILQESPILVQDSSVLLPPGSITKRWSDPSPRENKKERLKLRKYSDAPAMIPISDDDCDDDDCAKSIPFRQSKRLKLGSS